MDRGCGASARDAEIGLGKTSMMKREPNAIIAGGSSSRSPIKAGGYANERQMPPLRQTGEF